MRRFVLAPEDLIFSGRNLNPIHANYMRVDHKPENVHNVALKSWNAFSGFIGEEILKPTMIPFEES